MMMILILLAVQILCLEFALSDPILLEVLADNKPHRLEIDNARLAPEDFKEHKRTIRKFCAEDVSLGYATTACEQNCFDFLHSHCQDVTPLHVQTQRDCIYAVEAEIGPAAMAPNRVSVDMDGLSVSTTLRINRRLSFPGMSVHTVCALNSFMVHTLNASLLVDLNCDDQGIVMGRAIRSKYICVSGRPELAADHVAFFSSPTKEFVLADVYPPGPAVLSDIRRRSKLWSDSDVVVVLARRFLEYMPYSKSLDFLQQVKRSNAKFFVTSNTVGALFHNPVELDVVSEYTPLKMQLYPFQLRRTRLKWRESHSPVSTTEIYDVQKDIPSGYPYYSDEVICGEDATPINRALYGSDCDRLNVLNSDNWALFVHRSQGSFYSQDGQDGALKYIFEHIGIKSRSFVEFGFNGPTYEDDTGSNSHYLYRNGWRGLLLDGGNSNPEINLHATWITPETIVSVFDAHNVPEEVDYLSIDIDSAELWIFRAIVSSGKYRPRVISAEYNSNYPLEATLCNIGGSYRWKVDRIGGSALLPLKMVGDEFGYSLVDVVSYLDAIFVRNDLLNGSAVPDFETWRPYTSRPHHRAGIAGHAAMREYLMDYAEWSKNGHDLQKSQGDLVFEQIKRLNIAL